MKNNLYSIFIVLSAVFICCKNQQVRIMLEHGPDASAGVEDCYIIHTPTATYYLEKTGGGLSSLVDNVLKILAQKE